MITKGLQDLERRYARAAARLRGASAAGVRRVGTTVRANQTRAIGQIINLRASVLKNALRIVSQPTADKPAIVFEVRGDTVALREYGARQTKRGVSVLVLRGAGRKIVGGGAFMARGYGNNLQVFWRTGLPKRLMRAGRYSGKMREPIERLLGPDIYSQFIKPLIQDVGDKTWRERLPIELQRANDQALRSAGLL